MSVQRRVNWISQQRVDVPDLRAIESAGSNDFDQLFQGFVTDTTQGYVVRGFNILMAGAIGGAASNLQMQVDPGCLLHINASQSGTNLVIPAGTPAQILNSAINTNVTGSFTPSAVNYVTVDYIRFLDDTTSTQVKLWDPTALIETTINAPRAQILTYTINISTITPTPNLLPIATVITDAGNNVLSVQDDRWLFCRLGTGGLNPNPFYTYPWTQGRNENPSTSSSDSVDPFSGGDKNIGSLKELLNAIMSVIKEFKGTTYWYSVSAAGSLVSLRQDLGNTVVTGRGSISHGVSPVDKKTATAAGQMNWDQPINIRVIGSALTYTLAANASSTDITLSDDQCAYVTLVREVPIAPNLVFTNGSPVITSVGAISWTNGLQAGDYIKNAADTSAGYYAILTVDSLSQVTLTTPYGGLSTGISGAQAQYAFGTYVTSPTPSTNRDIFISSRETVPQNENVFWLFLRNDNGGANARVYIRFLGAELDNGEDRDVSDTTSQELLIYIGSPSESAYLPQYVAALTPGSVPEIQQLTFGTAAQTPQNSYFLINSSADARKYYAWFDKDGLGVDPMVPDAVGIQINIATGQTNIQIATAVSGALNSTLFDDFSAVSSSNQVTVTNTSSGACTAATDGNVGAPFAVVVVQSGTGVGNYFIHDGDSLTLAIKELDRAIGDFVAAVNDPDYDETIDIVSSGATPPTSLNGPVLSGTVITLPNNSRMGNVAQKYTVGKGYLEIFLNGQYLRLGQDWSEIGSSGHLSTTFTLLYNLVVGDFLELRINSQGGGGTGEAGPAGPPGPTGPPGSNAVGGPISISTKNASYTVLLSDNVLLANCSTGMVVFTLPPAATATGRVFWFKKVDATLNAMRLMANGVELIDGANTQDFTIQYESIILITDGTSWYIF